MIIFILILYLGISGKIIIHFSHYDNIPKYALVCNKH